MKYGRTSTFCSIAVAAVAALALSAMASPVSPVSAAPPADRTAAFAAAGTVTGATQIPSGWTGSAERCDAGTESPHSLAATLTAVNTLRSFAGVGEVAFSPEKNEKALAAAMMMRAKGALTHYPDPAWPCYSESGAEGAGSSNLSLGGSGATAMLHYLDDRRVESLGHRRWLLHPGAVEFGSGSTGSTNALYVVNPTGDGSRQDALPADNLVAWPPAGWVPWPWFFEDWSLAIGRPVFDREAPDYVEISTAATVAVSIDGKPLPVHNLRQMERGYGTGPLLTWQVDIPAAAKNGDAIIDVSVTGITLAGAPLPVNYRVLPFKSEWVHISPPQHIAKVCPSLRKKLKRSNQRVTRTKRRLNRLKRSAKKSTTRARLAPKLKRARRDLKAAKRARKQSKAQFNRRCDQPRM